MPTTITIAMLAIGVSTIAMSAIGVVAIALLAISIVLLVVLDDNIPSSHLILNIGIAF
jgi:hypothetical protein